MEKIAFGIKEIQILFDNFGPISLLAFIIHYLLFQMEIYKFL
jgi:hypothetical protein